jgi:hypothetical protein
VLWAARFSEGALVFWNPSGSRSISRSGSSWRAPRNFMRPDTELTRLGIQRIGRVSLAESRFVDTAALCEFVLARLREDPDYLRA